MALHSLPRRHRTYCGPPRQPSDMGWVQGAKSQTRCGQPLESPEMATVALACFFTHGTRPLEHEEPAARHTVISPTAGPGSKRATTRHDTTRHDRWLRWGSSSTDLAAAALLVTNVGQPWGGVGVCGVEGHSTTMGPATRARHRLVTVAPALPPSYGDERTHTTVGHVINTSAIGS